MICERCLKFVQDFEVNMIQFDNFYDGTSEVICMECDRILMEKFIENMYGDQQ